MSIPPEPSKSRCLCPCMHELGDKECADCANGKHDTFINPEWVDWWLENGAISEELKVAKAELRQQLQTLIPLMATLQQKAFEMFAEQNIAKANPK